MLEGPQSTFGGLPIKTLGSMFRDPLRPMLEGTPLDEARWSPEIRLEAPETNARALLMSP